MAILEQKDRLKNGIQSGTNRGGCLKKDGFSKTAEGSEKAKRKQMRGVDKEDIPEDSKFEGWAI